MYKKVLVIDDNEMDLYVAKRMIEKYSFAEEVVLMDSAKEAMEYLMACLDKEEDLPNLIFLDINMPEMNGFEFLDAYTRLPDCIRQNCIIMMLTTSAHFDDEERAGKNPYVRNFLSKPLCEDNLKIIK